MIGLEIGPARVLDAGTLGAVMGAANDRLSWLPRVQSRAEDIHHVGSMVDAGWVTVARQEGQILGFIACDGAEVHGLYLRPEVQGKGVARALMDHVKSARAKLGLWSYEANARATRFYKKAGFAETARSEGARNDVGLPDIRFEWHRKETK